MIVYHHNDHDGRCAAAIVKKWANAKGETTTFIEVDYAKEVPIEIVKNETVVIVDFSFKPEVMEEIQKKASMVIWIDHHATAKDYPYQDLPGLRDFTPKGQSGCELAWHHFFDYYVPETVKLIGDYDSWRLKMKPKCFELFEGLKIENTSPESQIWMELLDDMSPKSTKRLEEIIIQGKAAIKYRDAYCAEFRKSFGHEVSLSGHKSYAMNLTRFGSAAFGDEMKNHDMCIAYAHDGNKWTVSLYSEMMDVGELAKEYGGGGHKGAAGFVCEKLPWE